MAQIASARELRLTGALKSSPPPELILEDNNNGRLERFGYITLVTLTVTSRLITLPALGPAEHLCDTSLWYPR